ncbi:MAG TPA: hypothetical protein VK631_08960, partial [Solirubrobacteraceae bacterium]|nr:hypothetical protein [Solirubrobacteraceae bacterium]
MGDGLVGAVSPGDLHVEHLCDGQRATRAGDCRLDGDYCRQADIGGVICTLTVTIAVNVQIARTRGRFRGTAANAP